MSKKILFIEDEPDQVTMVKMRIEAQGYQFIAAMDGEDGLKKVREEKPNLILLDFLLPKINGYELCKQFKKDPDIKDIPIIIITAYSAKDLEKKCLECGVHACVRKPYDSADLVAKIKEIIGEA